jgi:hypothetical protein
MRIIGRASEAEMVAAFLRAEIDSTRFSSAISQSLARYGVDSAIVYHPDTRDAQDNAVRRAVLKDARHYGENTMLFHGFPEDVDWFRVELARDEVADVRYIVFSYWIELTNGSLRAGDAIEMIRSGKEVFDVSNDNFYAVAADFVKGKEFPELILVGKDFEQLVVLEGHLRLTGYLLAGQDAPATLTVLVGISSRIDQWKLFSYASHDRSRDQD